MPRPYRTGVKEIPEDDLLMAKQGRPGFFLEVETIPVDPMECVQNTEDTQGNAGWESVRPSGDNGAVKGIEARKADPTPGGGWD